MALVISSVGGTRSTPKDGYIFLRNTTVKFKTVFMSEGAPTVVDNNTQPYIKIIQPKFLSNTGSTIPVVLDTINGSLVAGQDYEYEFTWAIPANMTPSDEYIVMYGGWLGGIEMVFGDEFFTISAGPGTVDLKFPVYATVDDVRKKKFNIDSYLPEVYAKDKQQRDNIIDDHLQDAAERLREELSMHGNRGNSVAYKTFCVYYTIWTIMLASRGEDGSSISDSNLATWQAEWQRVLAQIKRKNVPQGITFSRG